MNKKIIFLAIILSITILNFQKIVFASQQPSVSNIKDTGPVIDGSFIIFSASVTIYQGNSSVVYFCRDADCTLYWCSWWSSSSSISCSYTTTSNDIGTNQYYVKACDNSEQSLCSNIIGPFSFTVTATCGDDICSPIENPSNCAADCSSNTCMDSDDGKDYYVKGTTQGIQQNGNFTATSTDVCMVNNNRLDYAGDTVVEYYCNGQFVNINYYKCPNGCINGACVNYTSNYTTCTDSDGGKNYYVKGQAILSTGANLIDACPTTSPYKAGITLLEAYCTNVSPFVVYQEYECPYGCSNGACLSEPVNTTCTDSDGGKNYYVKGTVAVCTYSSQGGGCGVGSDYCADNILKEGYCEGTTSKLVDFTCPYGCSNGVCLSGTEKCTNHAQCSKACDNLGIAFHWSGTGSSYKSWNGTCSSNVYGCMTGQCCLGQCNYKTTGDCYCARTNIVDIYGNVCPSGQTCGSDCYCHPTTEGKPDLTIEKIEYYIDNPTNPTKLYFQTYIKNIGTAPCSFSSSVRVPQLSNSQDNKCTYLNAGESCIETGYGYNGLGGTIPAGYYEIKGFVDHQNLVDEFNENNNQLSVGTYIPSETIQFKLYPNKYFYYKGEVVEIKAIVSSSSNIDFQNSKLEINLKDPNGNVIILPVEKIGTVAVACEASTITKSYTCPAINQYSFYAKYEIPSNATLGLYSVSGKAIVGSIEKNAYSSFQVGEVYSGLVEVSIYPKSVTTLIGNAVEYKVTVTDKHPVPLCAATTQTQVVPTTGGIITSEEAVKMCGTIIYNYLIEIDGLPYHTVFPTVASVHAGSSKTFELKVFPSPAKTAEGITTAVEKTAITKAVKEERAVSITGGPIAETQPVETTSESASVKEALFKFTVKTYLKDDSSIADSDSAVLIVKFTEGPEPPPFPETEKINIDLRKGWNLVSLPGKGTGFSYGTCSKTKKPVAFLYLQDRKKYVSLWDAINELGAEEILDYLSTHSFWVYSYEDCNIGFKVESYSSYSNLYIYKGWNLLGTTKDMIGETLNNIKGACSFEKIYIWDAESQKWIEKSENDLIEKMGYGILIKSTSECNLKENLIQPPSFPGD